MFIRKQKKITFQSGSGVQMNNNIAKQLTDIIDFSVVAFLFVYMICVLAYLKTLIKEKAKYYHWIYALGALFFCSWIIYQTPLLTIGTSLIFTLSGLPVYFLWYRKKSDLSPKMDLNHRTESVS